MVHPRRRPVHLICKLKQPIQVIILHSPSILTGHGRIKVLIRAIYNLYFSPLANYPGPFFAKLSVWPSFWHTVRSDRHVWVWKCHQVYGTLYYGAFAY